MGEKACLSKVDIKVKCPIHGSNETCWKEVEQVTLWVNDMLLKSTDLVHILYILIVFLKLVIGISNYYFICENKNVE